MQLWGSVVAMKFFISNFIFATWTVKQFLDPQLHLAKHWRQASSVDRNTMKDYYKILGVSKNATTADIKKIFRKKALSIHPDKSGRDTKDEFIELFEAYEILVDQKKRKRYDLIYDWISTPTTEQDDKELEKDILSIHEKGFVYARNFNKFNKEVIIYILLDLFFSKFMLGAVALTIIGICTIGKGIMNLALDYCLIGVVMTLIGIWFSKITLDRIAAEASR